MICTYVLVCLCLFVTEATREVSRRAPYVEARSIKADSIQGQNRLLRSWVGRMLSGWITNILAENLGTIAMLVKTK